MPEPHVLLDGLGLGELPRWHDGRLWFANWIANELTAVAPDGRAEVILRRPSYPFSLDWLPDGRLLVIAGRERLLLRREPGGTLVAHADLTALAETSFNELVVDGRGHAYVNNVGFAFPGGEFRPGTVALVTRDGTAHEVAGGLAFPNGMAVTADNATLLVAE